MERRRKRLRGPWALTIIALVAVVLPVMSQPARADVLELPLLDAECVDTVAEGFALDDGVRTPAAGVDVDVPGPVVRVIVEWMGRDDADTGTSALALEVTGPGGSQADTARPGTLAAADNTHTNGGGDNIYAWWADITDLFGAGSAGTYNVAVEPFATPGLGVSWGGVVTVVYDTAPCSQLNDGIWKIGADYYFGGSTGSGATTDLIVYDWEGKLDEDLTVTVRTSHGGADGGTKQCRMSSVWAATGVDPAPVVTDSLADGHGNAVTPGATTIVSNPFSPPGQSCPPSAVGAPAVALRGGNIGPEFALIEIDIVIPAGAEWLAFQLESPSDNGGFRGRPESGAWGGGGVLVLPSLDDPAPGITLEKTVLDGAGGTCPGSSGADEVIATETGDPVTFCFRIINTGTTPLFPVALNDATLGAATRDMTLVSGDESTPLLIGGEMVYSYEAVATADLVNSATVTGTPADASGEALGLPDVTAVDRAEVIVLEPGLKLEKTVLPGHEAACPGANGQDELREGGTGSPITYCYRLANTGEVDLANVELNDADLGITSAEMALVSGDASDGMTPGEIVVWSYQTTIHEDFTSTATATAVTADKRISTATVTATDTATVALLTGAISLHKTVLAGSEACPSTAGVNKQQTGVSGAAVVYCYVVTNTGSLPIQQITLDDPEVGMDGSDVPLTPATVVGDALLPGASMLFSHPATIQADLTSTATVTGILADLDGAPLGLTVTATDDAAVALVVPGLSLQKTVAEGHATGCGPGEGGEELTVDDAGARVTFCFRIVNTGETALYPVTLLDTTYDVTQADMELVAGDANAPLQPGAELVYAWRTTIASDVINIAVATGTPADPTGTALAPASAVTAESAVRVAVAQQEPPAQEELPVTGISTAYQLWVALSLVFTGAAMVLLSRGRVFTKRRTPSSPAS